ncbi:hypothetical protein D3C86_1274460 [compost metagenome]
MSFSEACFTPPSFLSHEEKEAASKECPPRSMKKSASTLISLPGNKYFKPASTRVLSGSSSLMRICSSGFISNKTCGTGSSLRLIFPLGSLGILSSTTITSGTIYGGNALANSILDR